MQLAVMEMRQKTNLVPDRVSRRAQFLDRQLNLVTGEYELVSWYLRLGFQSST